MSAMKPLLTGLAVAAVVLSLASASVRAADPAAASGKPGGTAKANAKASPPTAQSAPVQVPTLSAAQVLERHIAARGGAAAWKAVESLQLSGKMEAGRGDSYARAMKLVEAGKKTSGKGTAAEVAAANGPKEEPAQVLLPFTLDLKRPNKTRLEIVFAGKTAVQVFDGRSGWKLRPYLNRTDAEPFTKEEVDTEAARDDLDGPLMGAVARGAKVDLDGAELVDGNPAYKLKITRKGGDIKHVWVDAKSFLDVKTDGSPRRLDGRMHNVYVYQRDFRKVDGGVLLPFVLETAVEGYTDTHKMLIEKATVNPRLDDALFAKPHA